MADERTPLADAILDRAVELADETSWERLYLYQVADSLGIGLDELRRRFAVKDDLVEAWYDRADRAMLQAAANPGFASLRHRTRLHTLIMAWLDSLATHKAVSRDMLLYKLEPAHIHLQVQGLLRISRTVQWLREAARMESTHVRRILEEIGLSGIFVKTVVYWAFDRSPGQARTRVFLDRQLARAETLATALFRQLPAQPAHDSPGRTTLSHD